MENHVKLLDDSWEMWIEGNTSMSDTHHESRSPPYGLDLSYNGGAPVTLVALLTIVTGWWLTYPSEKYESSMANPFWSDPTSTAKG